MRIIKITAVAVLATGLLGTGAAARTLAPGAGASGTAVRSEAADTTIGGAEAHAGPEQDSYAKATAARVAGNDIAAGDTSGGPSTGSAAEVPVGAGRVRVLPHEAVRMMAHGDGQGASAYAALLDATFPGLVRLEVLSSRAAAWWFDGNGSSRASSDAVRAELAGGTKLLVLHAEGDGRSGRLALVQLNETAVESPQPGRPVRISIDGVGTIELLAEETTPWSYDGTVLRTLPLDIDALRTELVDVHTHEVDEPRPPLHPDPTPSPTPPVGPTPTPDVHADPAPEQDDHTIIAAGTRGRLPRTGAEIRIVAAAGLAMLLLGAGLRTVARLV